VVLKVLKEELQNDEVFVNDFEREKHLLLRLNHPNVARIIAAGASLSTSARKPNEYVTQEAHQHAS
jgi:serine/threonine protein kinase